jgi:hypothetical protein
VSVRKERGGPASKNTRKDRVPNVKIQERKKIKNSSNNLEIDQVLDEKATISFLLKWTKSPYACKIRNKSQILKNSKTKFSKLDFTRISTP